MTHTSVLLQETIAGLDIEPGDIVVDGTLGSAGHTEEIVKRFGNTVRIIGIDMDEDALTRSKERLKSLNATITFVRNNFRNIDQILDDLKITQVHKILLDVGLSSDQLETSERGFSFQKSQPLLMTFKKEPTEEDITAYTIVNEWQETSIADILWGYGEERYSRKIAKAIVEAREFQPINTTTELVEIILSATPTRYHHQGIHPATRTFQALRIAVNDELQALQEGLQKGFERLITGGRMAIISFHSLEDRIVKRFFQEKAKQGIAHLITKKPITPTEAEIEQNRRSRSAKLRIVRKL